MYLVELTVAHDTVADVAAHTFEEVFAVVNAARHITGRITGTDDEARATLREILEDSAGSVVITFGGAVVTIVGCDSTVN